jgi:coenzyme F420-0:L-glutamate ligase/coenzyme F420-1:gamma-L-glutamate ligase
MPDTESRADAPAQFAAPRRLVLTALESLPLVERGDDIAALIAAALVREQFALRSGDVVIIAQKIVSKSEGRLVALESVEASARARDLAARIGKDPRLVELILQESRRVLRVGREVLIVEHRNGFVLANAGIDQSNVEQRGRTPHALLLPQDPDASAAGIRDALLRAVGLELAVLIIDSIGRAWRRGTVGQTLGAAGAAVVVDLRGAADLFGRKLRATDVAAADELAAAASILMGQAAERRPVVIARGYEKFGSAQTGRALQRAEHEDLFR